MYPWQINPRISRDVVSSTWSDALPARRRELAWSALPDAPTVPDDRGRRGALRRRLAAALIRTARRLDQHVGDPVPSPTC